jgi:hypothetical protein
MLRPYEKLENETRGNTGHLDGGESQSGSL